MPVPARNVRAALGLLSPPTAEEIEQARSRCRADGSPFNRHGWDRARLAAWGVAWPPPDGWRISLARRRARWELLVGKPARPVDPGSDTGYE